MGMRFPGNNLKSYIFLMVIVLPAAALFHTSAASGEDDLTGPTDRKVLVMLHPLRRATLSAEVSSVVKKIYHEMGEKFTKGGPLIDFGPALYLAEKEKADARLIFAVAAYETNRQLYNQKSVSGIELAKAKADLEISKTNVAIAKKRLAACSIRAPFSGRVVKLLVNESEWVQEGQPMIEIVDDRIMRAKFLVPSLFYGQLRIGQRMDVHVRGINGKFRSKITHISSMLESNTLTFQVFAEIDNSKNILRPGMTGEITLKLIKGTMPIRLTQVETLGYDPVHVRLPSDSFGVSASLP